VEGDRRRRAGNGGGGSSGEREGSAWEVRGEAESGVGLFIGAERRYPGRGGAHAELVRLQWRFGRRVRGGVNASL
jgi:hypothetical protein